MIEIGPNLSNAIIISALALSMAAVVIVMVRNL